MITDRQIDAYRRRLAKIEKAFGLTGECLDAVIAWADFVEGEPVVCCGTLVEFRIYTGVGLFGPTRYVDVTICTACVGEPASEQRCEESKATHTIVAGAVVDLFRNEDGVRDRAAAAFPDLIGAGT